MSAFAKRPPSGDRHSSPKKPKKQWQVPRQPRENGRKPPAEMEVGGSGIFATCVRNKEAKSVNELKDLFGAYADELKIRSETALDVEEQTATVEEEIERELNGLKKDLKEPLFQSVKLDTDCVLFFKTKSPIEPVPFVQTICEDMAKGASRTNLNFVKRLSPMTLIGKATENGLNHIASKVLKPHFHDQETEKKFAIRPTIRSHNVLSRDNVIQVVATAVGPGHKVDLDAYDLLILVEIYKNFCGVSVVGRDFERLKRYNLAELLDSSNEAQKLAGVTGPNGSAVGIAECKETSASEVAS